MIDMEKNNLRMVFLTIKLEDLKEVIDFQEILKKYLRGFLELLILLQFRLTVIIIISFYLEDGN